MTLLSCMSVAGSIPVILCLILWLIQGERYDCILGRRLLLTAIIFFLTPFQLVKYLLPADFTSVISIQKTEEIDFTDSMTFVGEGTDAYIWFPKWVTVLLLIWAALIILFAVYECVKYFIVSRKIMNCVDSSPVVKGNMVFYTGAYKGSPCALGFFRRKIVMPKSCIGHPTFEMIYRHEERHNLSYDSFMKVFCLVVLCFHWMNPFAYILLFLYRFNAECVSDLYAVTGCTKEEIYGYSEILINISSEKTALPFVWTNNLAADKKLLQRRIMYMTKKNKLGVLKKGILLAVSAMTVVASAGTVLAYEPMQSSDGSFRNAVVVKEPDSSIFKHKAFSDNIDFSKGNNVFIRGDGTQIVVKENEVETPRALCIHSMENGYFSTHKKNSSGGCTVEEYTCQRCKKCGYLANAVLYGTYTYPKCPH